MIKRLLNYRKKIEILHYFFDRYRLYLKPGRYVIANEKLIHRIDPETKTFLSILLGNEESYYFAQSNRNLKYFIKKLLHQKNLIISNCNNHHGIEGTVLYLKSGRNGIRIFDFFHKKVLSTYCSTESFNEHMDNYFYYSRYFAIPPMIMHDLDEKTCIEKLIISNPGSQWVKNDEKTVFDKVCDIYHGYYQNCLQEKNFTLKNVDTMIRELKKDSILIEISIGLQQNIPDELLSIRYPCVKQHGDLWSANILLGESSNHEIFFVDWEHAGEYFFFFDLFKWMDLEAEKNCNARYLKYYLTGVYDDYFQKIFELWGENFDKKNRKAYYLIYIADYFYHRVLDKNEIRKREVQEKYMSFVNLFPGSLAR